MPLHGGISFQTSWTWQVLSTRAYPWKCSWNKRCIPKETESRDTRKSNCWEGYCTHDFNININDDMKMMKISNHIHSYNCAKIGKVDLSTQRKLLCVGLLFVGTCAYMHPIPSMYGIYIFMYIWVRVARSWSPPPPLHGMVPHSTSSNSSSTSTSTSTT